MRGSIAAIKFGLLWPEMIRSMAVAEISNPETYDEDGSPIPTGVMDPRLGTLEPGQRCRTCGNTYLNCPGHFGYIELAVPVIHIGYVKTIHELLRTTCWSCGRLLLSDEQIEKFRAEVERLKAEGRQYRHIFYRVKQQAMAATTCPHCGEKQVKVELEKPMTFYEQTSRGMVRLTASVIRQRLEKIPDSDLELLDMDPKSARPEWMVLTVLPVPPVYVRPSITLETGYRSEDDLTHKLVDILRTNQRLREAIASGAPSPVIIELADLLQYHVTTYLNNEVPNLAPAQHRSGRILKTLAQRLKGKEGRFRLNLSGKRVDFSARTVISPDPNIDIDEVGVPLEIAMQLTVPEPVTAWNKEWLKQLVRNGPNKYPGARYVIRPDKRIVRLKFVQNLDELAEQLEEGWVVERHLMDGDIVLFNRQPSLHRISIMAHRVRVMPYKTFRLNLMVCTPYNADFDGDEMNLHVPQSPEAQAEARLLLQVQRNVISPRYGAPIIGAIRDFLTSSYLLTAKAKGIDKQLTGYLLSAMGHSGPLPPPEGDGGRWTGAQIFSLLLPKDLNFEGQASFNPDDVTVIREGKLVKGYADKALIGIEKPNSLLHRIARDYGPDAVARFLNSLIRLTNTYINLVGFTLSIEDLLVSPKAKEEKTRLLQQMEKEYEVLWRKYRDGTIEVGPGQTPEKAFEAQLLEILSRTRDQVGSAYRKLLSPGNPLIVMARTGARGSSLNIDQMTAIVGQQAVRRERPSRGFTDRVLPHFRPGDLSPSSRGFVYSSFVEGLDPIEYFFHMMGGRDGLVDTAVRTQQSGYMQRRLINALESLYVEFDGSVRTSDTKRIVQFLYGEDGVDPAKSDHGRPFTSKVLISRVLAGYTGDQTPATKEDVEAVASRYREVMPRRWVNELARACVGNVPKGALEQVFRAAYDAYLSSLVEPGDPVGIIAAQSIGEPGTQLTLRTFHFAGVREQSILLGLPRLIEIVDAKREPSTPVMRVYLKPPHNTDLKFVRQFARSIQCTYLRDVVLSYSIDLRRGQLVFKLDREAMSDLGVTKKQLEAALKAYKPQITEDELRITVPKDELADITSFRDRLLNVKVKGIRKVTKAIVRREGDEFYIETEGSNLKEVLEMPEVDPARVRTNDIHEVAEVLGIEAARALIIDEIMNVLRDQGLDVDVRHVMLVADMMTVDGSVKQIGRHGVVRLKSSVLARAAFEISVQTLLEAAIRGETDHLRSNVERILIGKEIPVGTGMVQLLMRYTPMVQEEGAGSPELNGANS